LAFDGALAARGARRKNAKNGVKKSIETTSFCLAVTLCEMKKAGSKTRPFYFRPKFTRAI
jgi:hypothetical protein